MSVKKLVLTGLSVGMVVTALALYVPGHAQATPDKAAATGKTCSQCHTGNPPSLANAPKSTPAPAPAKTTTTTTKTTTTTTASKGLPAVKNASAFVGKNVTVTASRLNFRASGSLSAKVLGVVTKGTTLSASAQSSGWLKVTYKGQTGYVYGYYVVLAKTQPAPKPTTTTIKPVTPAGPTTIELLNAIVPEYANAANKHNIINMSQGVSNSCIACHNGKAYELQATDIAAAPLNNTVGNTAGCTTCHGERGQALMAKKSITSETVNTALGIASLSLGKGNLCASCHYGRAKVADVTKGTAPHLSPQTDIFEGKSGAIVTNGTPSVHTIIQDTCVECHLAKDSKGVPNHEFQVDSTNVKAACGTCHTGLTSPNRTAEGDYDGNGKIEGIQTEVEGLLKLVEDAYTEKLTAAGITFAESHGAFVFTNADGSKATPSTDVYNAIWNHSLVENDGSLGVHNPTYVVQLLQASYKAVTGNNVPNAKLK